MRVPARVALRVLCSDARRRAVGAAEHDRAAHLPARHVQRLRRRVDDVVHRLHGEVERHELDDRLQSVQRGADRHAGEAVLGDRRIDHPLRAELVEQTLADLVGALVLRDFLADQEHLVVAAQFRRHRVAQRLAHRDRLGRSPVLVRLRARGRLRRAARQRAAAALARRRCFRLRCGLRRRRRRRHVLAVHRQHRDRRVHRDAFGAFIHQDLRQLALVDRLDLHRRLVGLDLGDHVAGAHIVADMLQPARQLALGHGRATAPASGSGWTSLSPPPARRSRVRPRPAPDCSARSRRRPG